jgi:hypothetical protein
MKMQANNNRQHSLSAYADTDTDAILGYANVVNNHICIPFTLYIYMV